MTARTDDETPALSPRARRELAALDKVRGPGQVEAILISHQRRDTGSCLCGWAELGKSHAGHQAAMLAEAGLIHPLPGASAAAAEDVAQRFHETYERLAPEHGYQTRQASAKPWAEVPPANRGLMVATVQHLIDSGVIGTSTTP